MTEFVIRRLMNILCFVDHASRYNPVIRTKFMQYLSSVHFVNEPLHVSDMLC